MTDGQAQGFRSQEDKRELLYTKQTTYLGHIYHNNKYDILKLITERKVEGKRGPGRRQYS